MDIEQIMNRLREASDDELAQALDSVHSEAGELRQLQDLSEENVESLERYAEVRRTLRAEQSRRVELAQRAESAAAEFTDDSEATGDDGTGDPDNTSDGEDTGDDTGSDGEEGETVTASGRRKLGGITKRQHAAPPVAEFSGQVRTVTRVQGDIPGFHMGSQLDRQGLAQAFTEKAKTLNQVRVNGTQRYHVARIEHQFPDERRLSADSFALNQQRLEAANAANAAQQGLTAALCQPLEPVYDISVIGVTNRPIRDALTRFGVDRGGITYRAPFDALSGLSAEGMGVWTPADDDAEPLVPKTCLEVSCPSPIEAELYATYLCLTFPNFTARFDQEWVEATTRASLVAWARFAENELLKHILAGSKQLTAPLQVSATRDILTNMDKAIAYYRYRHRLDTMVPLRWIAPRWVLDLMRADLTRGMAGDLDALEIADSRIARFFSMRGVSVTWHLDGLADGIYTETDPDLTIDVSQQYADASAGTAIPDFITEIESALFAEGDWLLLDGGTMDLGLVRDSTLNSQNRYQTFVESYEAPAFNGIESLRLTMDVEPTGWSVGTIDPPASDVATYPARTVIS